MTQNTAPGEALKAAVTRQQVVRDAAKQVSADIAAQVEAEREARRNQGGDQ